MNTPKAIACLGLFVLFSLLPVVAQISAPNLALAKPAIDSEDWDTAILYLTRAIDADEGKGNVIIAAGTYAYRCRAYFNKNKFDLAVSDCDRSIEIKADSASVYHLRASSLSRLGKHERAIADYTHAIQLQPNQADHYVSRGISHSRSGNRDLAIVDFTKALELDPKDEGALLMRATQLRGKGDYDQALFDYEAVTRLVPSSVEAHIGLGLSYFHKRNYDRSLASYNRALELNPRSKDALLFRGVLYAAQAEYDLAFRDYGEALKVDPSFVSAYTLRGEAYVKKGDYQNAVADFTKGLALEAGKATLYARAWANLYANDGRAALADAQKYLEAGGAGDQGSYVVIVGYLGLRKQNKKAEADVFLRSVMKQFNQPPWLVQVEGYLLGDLTEKQLLELATDNDKATEARAYIGMVKLFAGDNAAARSHFEWVRTNGNKNFAEFNLALAELGRMPRTTQ